MTVVELRLTTHLALAARFFESASVRATRGGGLTGGSRLVVLENLSTGIPRSSVMQRQTRPDLCLGPYVSPGTPCVACGVDAPTAAPAFCETSPPVKVRPGYRQRCGIWQAVVGRYGPQNVKRNSASGASAHRPFLRPLRSGWATLIALQLFATASCAGGARAELATAAVQRPFGLPGRSLRGPLHGSPHCSASSDAFG